jgi:hypothetical protein
MYTWAPSKIGQLASLPVFRRGDCAWTNISADPYSGIDNSSLALV